MHISTIIASLVLAYTTSAFHIPSYNHPSNSSAPSANHPILTSNSTHGSWNMTAAPGNHTHQMHARGYFDHITCPSGSSHRNAKINLIDTLACCKDKTYDKLDDTLTSDGRLNCHLDGYQGDLFEDPTPDHNGLPENGQKCIGGYKVCEDNPRGCCDDKPTCSNAAHTGASIAPCAPK